MTRFALSVHTDQQMQEAITLLHGKGFIGLDTFDTLYDRKETIIYVPSPTSLNPKRMTFGCRPYCEKNYPRLPIISFDEFMSEDFDASNFERKMVVYETPETQQPIFIHYRGERIDIGGENISFGTFKHIYETYIKQ